jgi:hydrogenase expression/formation protein HypE
MMHDLIDHLFAPAFARPGQAYPNGDAAILNLDAAGRLAFTTDTFVVSPLFFPGGDIGSLAVHGTVNDLAAMGAQPLYLSAGFVLEEGLDMETLSQVVASLAAAAEAAGVQIVTGDTKVVERGHGDGLYINTSGVGLVPAGLDLGPHHIRSGDALLVNGTLGDHGIAIMSRRNGLQFESEITSDSAALHTLVADLLATCLQTRALRDLTRGGLAAAANELAKAAAVGMEISEPAVPVQPAVACACELLGLDPLHVANEGKLLAIVPAASAETALAALRAHPLGRQAAIIGRVTADQPGLVVGCTAIGGRRVIDMPPGELLPRIC